MATGSKRLRGTSWELRAYAGDRRQVTRTVKGVNGKPVGERAADAALRKLLTEVDDGRHATAGTFGELLDRWWSTHAPGWSPTTRASTGIYVAKHVRPHLGHLQVTRLRADDLDHLYATLPLAPASVGKVHAIIRRALSQAVRWGWVPTNVADLASPPRVRQREIQPPDPADVRRLLTLATERSPELALFVRLSADTGARRGELVGLRWSDFHDGTVLIARAVVHDGQTLVVKSTKTEKQRRVSIAAPTVDAVTLLEKDRRGTCDQLEVEWSADRYLFNGDEVGDRPWRPDGATQRFTYLRQSAKLPNVRLHDLRHWVATTMLSEGVDQRTVMGRQGWSSLASLTRYSHFLPSADRAAADRLGQVLDGEQ